MASPQLGDGISAVVPLDEVPGPVLVSNSPVEVPVLESIEVVPVAALVDVGPVVLMVGRLVVGGSLLVLEGELLAVSRSTSPLPASPPE